jgi:hypothetical protein
VTYGGIGIGVCKVIEELFVPTNLNIGRILEELSSVGATSVRLLDEDFRVALLKEAQDYDYEPEDEIVGSGDRVVRQQVSSFDDFPEDSGYVLLKNSFQDLLEKRVAQLGTNPFEAALGFNSMVLQKYEEGSIGITPHRDGLSFINLVCVVVIGGRGSFYVCSDRSGKDSIKIDASPGNVIFMRAPGFLGSEDERPFHYVTDIREPRYTFGLRQKRL